ncbi:MAG: hypothetical protein ACLPUO_01970 [Streptosporangiaceae bacterium]
MAGGLQAGGQTGVDDDQDAWPEQGDASGPGRGCGRPGRAGQQPGSRRAGQNPPARSCWRRPAAANGPGRATGHSCGAGQDFGGRDRQGQGRSVGQGIGQDRDTGQDGRTRPRGAGENRARPDSAG